MSGKNSNWLSDIKQCIHYKEPDLDCTLIGVIVANKKHTLICKKKLQGQMKVVNLWKKHDADAS